VRVAPMVIGLALIIAACTKKPEKKEPLEKPFAPPAETVTLVTAYEAPLVQELLRGYLGERRDVQVKTRRLPAREIAALAREEKGEGPGDVVLGLPRGELASLARAGALLLPPQPPCPDVPPEHRDPAGAWVGVTLSALAVGVNETLLRRKQLPAPRTWKDLAHPRYRGWIVLARPPISRASQLLLAGVTSILHPRGWAFWKRLDRNLFQYADRADAPVRMIASGDTMITVDLDRRLIPAKRAHREIGIHWPSPTFFDVEGMAILKRARQVEAAARLVAWVCSEPAMRILERFRTGVTRPFVEPAEPWKPRLSQLKLHTEPLPPREKVLEDWKERFGN
jgi:iron(III) transport system substrate-binding protein